MLFSCEKCHLYTINRADYKKHLRTRKHIKLTNTDVSTVDENTSNEDDAHIESDESTPENYIVLNISDIPNKPKRPYNGFSSAKKVKPSYNKDQICKRCGVGYSYSSGLYRHMKKCLGTPKDQQTNTVVPNLNGVINTLLCENKEFKQLILDVIKTNTELIKSNQELASSQQDTANKVLELCKFNQASVTNNIYNHHGDNNHFSINVFLNEKCKDAMNMSDFVNSIEVTMDDVENVGRCGYVKGISTIFIDNLKNTDVHKRPIHCSDRKRQTLYVKESDKWERDEVNSDVLKTAVLRVGHKHGILINQWADEHPGCEQSYGRDSDRYMDICRHVNDGDDDKILKVAKNIANEIVIEKKVLM
jgi:hypothetical protein